MRVTIRHLRAFVEVAKQGSFTKAAEALNISQPALTVTINQLEEELDTKLLERTTRKVMLTLDGQDFLQIADRLVSEFYGEIGNFNNTISRKQRLLTIGEATSIGPCILPKILESFKQGYPKFNLRLEQASDLEIEQLIKDEKVIFAVSSPWKLDPELQYTQIAEDRFGIVVRNDSRYAGETGAINWAEIERETCIIGGGQGTSNWGHLSKEENIPSKFFTPEIEAAQASTMLMLVEQGTGIAIAPEAIMQICPYPNLIFRPLVSPNVSRGIHIVSKRHKHFSQEARSLMTLYKEHAKSGFANGASLQLTAPGEQPSATQITNNAIAAPLAAGAGTHA
ncbi:LysR family transcriptional regulator [Aestuariispira insulae]|uniref:LysR family transcriptional regulator n=1 Tax=Aestuariispira insulae TaxID=1461337 RepID=A0A3D9H2I7_9PROT|nr:LysR family transcriptional regulator [Aestuariispira insulae]RED43692.1 LysR family transcriptional regulator [Aestuariispira insulae]